MLRVYFAIAVLLCADRTPSLVSSSPAPSPANNLDISTELRRLHGSESSLSLPIKQKSASELLYQPRRPRHGLVHRERTLPFSRRGHTVDRRTSRAKYDSERHRRPQLESRITRNSVHWGARTLVETEPFRVKGHTGLWNSNTQGSSGEHSDRHRLSLRHVVAEDVRWPVEGWVEKEGELDSKEEAWRYFNSVFGRHKRDTEALQPTNCGPLGRRCRRIRMNHCHRRVCVRGHWARVCKAWRNNERVCLVTPYS